MRSLLRLLQAAHPVTRKPSAWRRQRLPGRIGEGGGACATFFGGASPFGKSRKTHHEQKILPFTPEQLFAVVSDVARYSEFVPFCVDSRILRRPGPHSMDAELAVGFRAFTERYTSRVTLVEPRQVVAEALDSRLFSELRSTWRFSPGPTAESSRVDFDVEFAVHNPLAAAAVGSFFQDVALQQVTAFERRCRQLYGSGATASKEAAAAPGDGGAAAVAAALPARTTTAGRPSGTPAETLITASASASEVAAREQTGGRRESLEKALPFAVCDAVAVLSELRRVKAVLLEHAGFSDAVPSARNSSNRVADAAAAAGAPVTARPRVLRMEDFEAACRVLGEEFEGFRVLAEDPALAAALYSSIKYTMRRRERSRNRAGGSSSGSGSSSIYGKQAPGAVAAGAGATEAPMGPRTRLHKVQAASSSNGALPTAGDAVAGITAVPDGAFVRAGEAEVGFSDNGLPLVGRALDDFGVTAYMMVQAGPDDRARFVFHAMDTDGNECLDREELQRALQAYMHGVGRVIPKLLAHQLQREVAAGQLSEDDRARMLRRGIAVVDQLMEEIMTEIPSAVEQIFLEARLDDSGAIPEGAWEAAWRNFPELLDMMSLRGLSKIVHWVALISEERKEKEDAATAAAAIATPGSVKSAAANAGGGLV